MIVATLCIVCVIAASACLVAGQLALLIKAVETLTSSQRISTAMLVGALQQLSLDQRDALKQLTDQQKYIVLTVDGLAVAAIVGPNDVRVVKH